MSKPFPTDHPFLRGYYAPVHTEADAANLPVTGELPADLAGTLYRNGPNPQFAPRGPYHWFAGDGMVHAFHIADGRVSYRNRWVHTPKWALERAEGEGLSGAFGNPAVSDPRIVQLNSTVANTNIVWFGGKLLALEEQHAPFALDPDTLEACGYETFGDRLNGPFTAHPKFDPVTGEMIFFGYSAKGRFSPWASIQSADRDGRITRADMLELPYASMIHDFAVTRHWIILPVFPLTGSLERARSGRPPYAWEPDKGTRIALIPRDGHIDQTRWVDAPACYVFHPMNHFEDAEGRIVIDVMKYDVAPLFPLPDGTPSSPHSARARLFRWTIDPQGAHTGIHERQLDDRAGEFPRFDERLCMSEYRHGWFVSGQITDAQRGRSATDGLVHIDLHSGVSHSWMPAEGDHCGEPVFVPRTETSVEGDGWVLCTVYRGMDNRSDLAVFEATDIAAGPIALAHLSSRVPAGFHGNWRPLLR